jgi:hypothetical protein
VLAREASCIATNLLGALAETRMPLARRSDVEQRCIGLLPFRAGKPAQVVAPKGNRPAALTSSVPTSRGGFTRSRCGAGAPAMTMDRSRRPEAAIAFEHGADQRLHPRPALSGASRTLARHVRVPGSLGSFFRRAIRAGGILSTLGGHVPCAAPHRG